MLPRGSASSHAAFSSMATKPSPAAARAARREGVSRTRRPICVVCPPVVDTVPLQLAHGAAQ
eukprot:scaffold58068_cov31-Tisochrysis_lutea.AAC.5